MAQVATCPNCAQPVTIPDGVGPADQVRCPLCEVECRLEQALARATEGDEAAELPPELVPVASASRDAEPLEAGSGLGDDPWADTESGPAEEPVEKTQAEAGQTEPADDEALADVSDTREPDARDAESVAAETEATVDEPKAPGDVSETPPGEAGEPTGEEEIVRVRCPCCDAEYALSQAIVAATGVPLGEAAAFLTGDGSPRQPAESAQQAPALEIWRHVEGAPQIDLGDGAGPRVADSDAAAFDFGQGESEDADATAGVAGRRRRKEKGGLRVLVGPVLGGIGGLIIAYYLLNWIKGEQGNFLEIPLPGVPHTYKYSPDWFPGWLKPVSDSQTDASDESSDFEWPEIPPPSDPQQPKSQLEAKPPQTSPSGAPEAASPKAKTFPPNYVGLVKPPSYTPDELAQVLQAANQSLPDPAKPVSDEAYEALCRLAEVVTFADERPRAQQLGVRLLLRKIAQSPANLDKIGHKAGALCVQQNRPGNGILLAGSLLTMVSEGNAYGARIELAASARPVLVASNKPLPAAEMDSVLVLGSIVDNPAENLVGFETQQPLVIWAGWVTKTGQSVSQ